MGKSRESMPKSKPEIKEAPKQLTGEKGRNEIYDPVLGPADGTVMQALDNYINAHEIHEADMMSKDPAKEVEDKMISEETIRRALASLPEREAKIITLRFGLGSENPKTLEDVGKAFGLSRDRIRQLEEHALRRMFGVAVRKLGFDEFKPRHDSSANLEPGWHATKIKKDILGDVIPTKPYIPKPRTE